MLYKSYSIKANTPSRMARKRARQAVFTFNKRAGKLRRKEARLSRKAQLLDGGE